MPGGVSARRVHRTGIGDPAIADPGHWRQSLALHAAVTQVLRTIGPCTRIGAPLPPMPEGPMSPKDDTRLGSPPEARHPTDDKPPRMALSLIIGMILACAVIVGMVLWAFGEVPGSG